MITWNDSRANSLADYLHKTDNELITHLRELRPKIVSDQALEQGTIEAVAIAAARADGYERALEKLEELSQRPEEPPASKENGSFTAM